jgi:hypothetical protein
VLHPIINKFVDKNIPYAIFSYNGSRSGKEYNRPTTNRLQKAVPTIMAKANKIATFNNDTKLLNLLMKYKCDKVVVIEFPLAHKSISLKTKQKGIKVYSINYLTDSIWNGDYSRVLNTHRTFYTAEYLRKFHFGVLGKPVDDVLTKCLGSPLLDQVKDIANGEETLVLLPNIRANHVSKVFGNEKRFTKIISNIYNKSGKLLFKTRKKQWLPPSVKTFAKEIIYDGDIMYPSALSKALARSKTVITFCSSGIYEVIYSGAYAVNIMVTKKQWRWNKGLLNKYFSNNPGDLYNYPGAVASVSVNDAINGNFSLEGANEQERQKWIKKFISDIPKDSAEAIADEIIKS